MPTATVKYLGELRTISTHVGSGDEVTMDAPVDNHGRGEAFSPTDLLCTSLASCMIITMAISARKNGFELEEASAEVIKIMADAPRRVGEIQITIKMTGDYTDEQRSILEAAALNCPVAKSLSSEVKQVVKFEY